MITSLLKNGNFECRNIHFECFKSVSIDSRNIPDDSIFCALKGDHTDGHRFIASAIRNGAKAALVSRQEISGDHLNYPLIIAEDSLKGLQEMARLHLAHLQTPVFALTGSVGKTSTRRLLHHVLSRSMTVFQSQKNFNNHIGLPLSILDIR